MCHTNNDRSHHTCSFDVLIRVLISQNDEATPTELALLRWAGARPGKGGRGGGEGG